MFQNVLKTVEIIKKKNIIRENYAMAWKQEEVELPRV